MTRIETFPRDTLIGAAVFIGNIAFLAATILALVG